MVINTPYLLSLQLLQLVLVMIDIKQLFSPLMHSNVLFQTHLSRCNRIQPTQIYKRIQPQPRWLPDFE